MRRNSRKDFRPADTAPANWSITVDSGSSDESPSARTSITESRLTSADRPTFPYTVNLQRSGAWFSVRSL